MCGRVDIHTPPAQLARILEAQLAAGVDPEGRPSWNVAPRRSVPAIIETDDRTRILDVFRWGLVPHWAKDPKIGYKMINARAETVSSKSAYRTALQRRRCLILADGFYEWMAPDPTQPKRKVPFYFRRSDGSPIAFAGLYETWWDKARSKEPDPASYMQTCVIITTAAGPDMVPVHDRMPVIVEARDFEAWLDPAEQDPEVVLKLLHPSSSGTLVRHPVSAEVNTPRNDGPHIILPVPEPDADLQLVLGPEPNSD